MRYERVRVKGRTFILKVTSETDWFLSGIEVNRDGDEVVPRGFERRSHLIDKTCITRRTPLRMNNHYGELEEINE